jgi:glycine reductase
MSQLRVAHYLNQFFAGIGGEDKANTPPGTESGPLGPANSMHQALSASGAGSVVATIFCGDTYFTEYEEEALDSIVELVRDSGADVLVAGPAFGSGRYGLACAQVCQKVASSLGIPVVTGMHSSSPGAEQYKGQVYMASTAETAVGMPTAISTMARLAIKLARGEELGPADENGYIPTGRVKTQVHEKTMAQRLVDMVLKKVNGEPFETEWPLPTMEKISPAPALDSLTGARIALVTEGGVVPRGNPDKIPSGWAKHWARYDIGETSDFTPDKWQSVHGGFDTTKLNDDPDRVVPLDVMRDLEEEEAIGKVHEYMYSTVGNIGYVADMKRFGQDIAAELQAAGVQGVILTGT